jgi:hypothetical protein
MKTNIRVLSPPPYLTSGEFGGQTGQRGASRHEFETRHLEDPHTGRMDESLASKFTALLGGCVCFHPGGWRFAHLFRFPS